MKIDKRIVFFFADIKAMFVLLNWHRIEAKLAYGIIFGFEVNFLIKYNWMIRVYSFMDIT